MKIALINEDSQANKNQLIYDTLNKVAKSYNHTVYNYGMYDKNNTNEINYTQIGIIASILIATEAADFIVTGCGTGQGAMMSCNAFSNLTCGYVKSPIDVYLISHINSANVISLPYAQEFGWGSEVILEQVFNELFKEDFGLGYPKMYAKEEAISRVKMYTDIKQKAQYPVLMALKNFDKAYLNKLLNYPEFKKLFFENAKRDNEITKYIKELIKD